MDLRNGRRAESLAKGTVSARLLVALQSFEQDNPCNFVVCSLTVSGSVSALGVFNIITELIQQPYYYPDGRA